MIFQLFRRGAENNSIASLYGAIVAQARAPAFYQSLGVPDTVAGRLEMILLHVVLVFRRLNGGAGPSRGQDCAQDERALGQALFDLFCQDMDDNLREMGVGDLAVPRSMRRIGEAFYGRQAAYAAALAADDLQALIDVLTRNVFEGGPGAVALAPYVREFVRRLDARDTAELRAGDFGFPDPAAAGKGAGRSQP
jgi:cytochrome b pre-mRNA-processing protein 3